LFGLTHEVARRFGRRVLLVPCFHDEPMARLRLLRRTYEAVGGILYHSPEEQALAQNVLGLNHPYASIVGTVLDLPAPEPIDRPRKKDEPPYVVYCGRFTPEKGIDRLLEYAKRYVAARPNRFRFVLMGQGDIALPHAPWLVNLGYVTDDIKREVIADARALVQLSTNESLSLVTLEAWAAAVPVIGHRDCPVMRGQMERSGGGATIGDYAEFAAALDSLSDDPHRWREAGAAGRRYVRENYSSRTAFAERLLEAIAGLDKPLEEQMRQKGLSRARMFDYAVWRKTLDEIVAQTLRRDFGERHLVLEVAPLLASKITRPQDRMVAVPVRVVNRGDLPAAAEGPARVELGYRLEDSEAKSRLAPLQVPLPNLLAPGQSLVTVVPVAVPQTPGRYRVVFFGYQPRQGEVKAPTGNTTVLELEVHTDDVPVEAAPVAGPLISGAQRSLAEANALKTLPTDYADVTQGFLAKWKRLVKRKLLHNFRRGYVDLLSRQQSDFNEKVLAALCQLLEGLQATSQAAAGANRLGDAAQLQAQLRRSRRQLRDLRRRHAQLERRLEAVEQRLECLSERKEVLT
jgi:hypothetical protein